MTIAKACINSVALYSLNVSGKPSKEAQEAMERIQRRFAKKILNARRCLKYEEEVGDLEHRIERCGAYELKRQILKEYLQKKLEADIKRLKLADIVLNSKEFETVMERKDRKMRRDFDNKIKKIVLIISAK